jgi:hypothetical protein
MFKGFIPKDWSESFKQEILTNSPTFLGANLNLKKE